MNVGTIWRRKTVDAALARRLAAKLGISPVTAEILAGRGFSTDQARLFLDGDRPLNDPRLMLGLDRAVARLRQALEAQEKITIYGDYDVDGVTATAVLYLTLRRLGARYVDYYIPDRRVEGYGLNAAALAALAADGTSLIVTVDCGITSVTEAAAMAGKVDLIITDHHQPPEELPPALAVLNPKQPGCSYPDKELAGVGVAYKLCQGLWSAIRREELTDFDDLVAVGTISDVVELRGENRLLVKRGLRAAAATKNTGLRALLKSCSLLDKPLDAVAVGFGLAPKINAAGRMSQAVYGVRLFTTEDEAAADALAKRLCDENLKRRLVEKCILQEIELNMELWPDDERRVLVVDGYHWHDGVVGIIAARLVDKYRRPAIVLTGDANNCKGSCRSIAAFNIFAALKQCGDLLERYGGHAQAAGLSVKRANVAALRSRLNEIAGRELSADDYVRELNIDAVLPLSALDFALIDELGRLEPYGMGNPAPVFMTENIRVMNARRIGKRKDSLKFTAGRFDCLAWNYGDHINVFSEEPRLDLAFCPEVNNWRQKTIQLNLRDYRRYGEASGCQPDGAGAKANNNLAMFFVTARLSPLAEQLAEGMLLTVARYGERQAAVYAGGALAAVMPDEIGDSLTDLLDCECSFCAVVMQLGYDSLDNAVAQLFVYKVNECERAQCSVGCSVSTALPQTLRSALDERGGLSISNCGGAVKTALYETCCRELANGERLLVITPLTAVESEYAALREAAKNAGRTVVQACCAASQDEYGRLLYALENRMADVVIATPQFLAAHQPQLERWLAGANRVIWPNWRADELTRLRRWPRLCEWLRRSSVWLLTAGADCEPVEELAVQAILPLADCGCGGRAVLTDVFRPSRTAVGQVFIILKRRMVQGMVELTMEELSGSVRQEFGSAPELVELVACLAVLRDLRLIFWCNYGDKRQIVMGRTPAEKLELAESLAFQECWHGCLP